MWFKLKKIPPKILANKDNAAVLANCDRSSGAEPTAVEKGRAEEVPKRGGVHATTLGGMIFRQTRQEKGTTGYIHMVYGAAYWPPCPIPRC
jgi:hypothetical protein